MITCTVSRYSLLDEAGEVGFVFLLIFVLKLFHVVTDVTSVDVVPETVRFQLSTLRVIANESLSTERRRRKGEKERGGGGIVVNFLQHLLGIHPLSLTLSLPPSPTFTCCSPMRDVNSSIEGTLHGGKDLVPCGGPGQTHVQERPEGA